MGPSIVVGVQMGDKTTKEVAWEPIMHRTTDITITKKVDHLPKKRSSLKLTSGNARIALSSIR